MKKYIYLFLILTALCYSSCSDNDIEDVFNESPQERISKAESKYLEIINESPEGWKTFYGTSDHIGQWLILMNFNEDGTVNFKCDPVDYLRVPFCEDTPITYRVDFLQEPLLVFESLSQFSIWNEIPVDTDGDGKLDTYSGTETQFIFDKIEGDKLYMTGLGNVGMGKSEDEIRHFVFEKATAADWDLAPIEAVKGTIMYDKTKGDFQRFSYKGELVNSLLVIDAFSRTVIYKNEQNEILTLPFYISQSGFTLVNPLTIEGVGDVQTFNVDVENETIVSASIPELSIVYGGMPAALERMKFDTFKNVYLGIEVYHATGDPIGRNLKKHFDNLRPPYAPDEQHLNVIYFAKDIQQDMGQVPFKYNKELTIIYADTDPAYSGKDLYGANPTFVRIPVEYETTSDNMWKISIVGTLKDAFIEAYPDDEAYATQKAEEALPMLNELLSEQGWGLYSQGTDGNNPTVKVINEEDPDGSFFTLYPYTQEDVDRSK